MFFMIGVNPQRKEYEYRGGVMICGKCGGYGRYRIYMTCMCLSLFFIPLFKWRKEYFAQSTCCGTTYALDPDIGRRIARGEEVEILPQHLREVSAGGRGSYGSYGSYGGYGGRAVRRCSACGYVTDEDFQFCPKCGRRF